MKRRQFCFSATATAIAATTALPAFQAQAQGVPTEGKQYDKLSTPAPITAPAGKIEVVEFFSYACPHCNALEPAFEAWVRKQPADVLVRRAPVPFLFNAENFQRTYYTLEAMGVIDKAHAQIFRGVHVEHKRFEKPEEVAEYLAPFGVDSAKFLQTFKSFGVQTKVNQTKQLMAAYKIDAVPAIGVQGRFITSGQGGAGGPAMLPVADAMIQRARTNT